MVMHAAILAAMLSAAPTQNPQDSTQGTVVTGAVDAPKTTTSGNEKATTDAAGVPKGTVGASPGSGSGSSDLNATSATRRRHHHRRTPPH
ncbi:MAG: hypothetical protein JOZ72_00440 [Alphaproteobacteria bacterium]|nr:hypothetical protein [Alphaproteobacteria bacterium]